MVTPGEFASPPTETTGAALLPWVLDTLALSGDIRAKFMRLQNWVKALLGDNDDKGK